MESYQKAVAAAASVAASAMLVRGVVNELMPYEVRDQLTFGLGYLWSRLSSRHTVVIEQTEGLAHNQLYDAVRAYLATRMDEDMPRLRVSSADESTSMMISMEEGEEMVDVYDGTEFKWCLICRENFSSHNRSRYRGGGGGGGNDSFRLEVRSFEMSFHKKYKEKALKFYLPHIRATVEAINKQDRTLQIYMNEDDTWIATDLNHSSTFSTLAMDSKMKQSIMDDLDRFVKRKDYYKRIGKAWKRGYLLYGPPGTGKSSFIAAMANHLKYDVYDLELTEVVWNSTLRRLLMGMTNRSILVIEDIDCTVKLQQREEGEDGTKSKSDGEGKVTLSGLLNFVDGLWSSNGEERIIIFTTNYKERLDAALLRPGRMDMHIHMGYCSPESFRTLAFNYHSIDYHVTYPEIEELIKEVMVTPAEVAEVLMRNDDTNVALQSLIQFLKEKGKDVQDDMAENEDIQKAEKKDEESQN